jgi:hypothetical protein
MFIPNMDCKVRRVIGTSVYGKPTFGNLEPAMCGIVRLEEMSEKTSVRADSSASRGSAMEDKILSRILVPESVRLKQGDELIVAGFTLVVQSVWPRFAIDGRQDHWQLDLLILAE